MSKLHIWSYIIIAVLVAVAANSVATVWAGKDSKFTIWLLFLLILSPLVFICFGLVTSKIGLAIGSGTIDSLLTVTTILVGLVVFREWGSLSMYQYIGVGLTIGGVVLMHINTD